MENNMSNDFYVYVHRRADDNLPFYVGKGRKQRAWNFYARNAYWNNTEKKHGVVVELVFENLTEEDAFQCEIDTILEYRYFGYPLTNLTDGGEGLTGYKHTEEQIQNAKEARQNSEKWRAGIQITAEKLRGRKLSEDHKEKISLGNIGKVFNEDTKQKMSESKKNCPEAMRHIRALTDSQKDKNVYVFYSLTGETFTGTREQFSKHTNIISNDVNKLFQKKGTRKSTHNWSLSPITITIPKKKQLKSPQRRSKAIDDVIYSFYHVLGEIFKGTRREFSDYSQIPPVNIAGLFCKNPRQTVYGWSLHEIDLSTYTHLKI